VFPRQPCTVTSASKALWFVYLRCVTPPSRSREVQKTEDTPPAQKRGFVPGKCLNCDEPIERRAALFCGERCRQIAELIRYARRKIADGTFERPDIAEAIKIRGGLLLAGGFYDRRGRAVAPEARAEILTRSKGRCEKCGREFGPEGDARFTIQHSVGAEGFILEAWCYRCNMDHVLATARPIETDDEWVFALEFNQRIKSKTPQRICDDADNWPSHFQGLMRLARAATKATAPSLKPRGVARQPTN
jgi:hypothetical protein